MTITKIYIHTYTDTYKVENHLSKNLLATVDVVIDYDIAVNDIKLMTGTKGEYLKFPNDDKGRNIAFPIKDDVRQQMLNTILDEYRKEHTNGEFYKCD